MSPRMQSELTQLVKTNPMLRTVNKDLMVTWINADLENRASFDVRTALVLYDASKTFVTALPPVMGPHPNEGLAKRLTQVGVRYYSTGIV